MFDDAPVSAEDKHRFKGLARRKENIRNEAHFIVSVLTLGGVPTPDELKVGCRHEVQHCTTII